MTNEIVTEVILDLKQAVDDLKEYQDESKKAGDKAGKGLGEGTEKAVSKSFKKLVGVAATAAAAIGAALFTRASINAAIEAENALQGVNTALRGIGEFSEANAQRVTAFADALEASTGIAAEAVQENFALAASFTQNAEQAELLTKAALDFAEGAQISFVEATRRLGRATQGSTDDIAKFVPEIRNLTKEQLAAGEATRLIQQRFSGFAEEASNTFSGSLLKANNAFGKLQEAIGKFVTESPIVQATIKRITGFFLELADRLDEFRVGQDIFDPLIKGAIFLGIALRPIIVIVDIIKNAFEVFRQGAATAIQGIISIATKSLTGFLEIAGLFTDKFEPLKQQVKDFQAQTNAAFLQNAQNTRDAISDLGDFDLAEALDKGLITLDEFRRRVNESSQGIKRDIQGTFEEPLEQSGDLFEEFAAGYAVTAEQIKAQSKSLGSTVRTSLVGGLSQGLASVGESFGRLQGGFKSLGAAVLQTIGTLAIQLGQFFILAGTAANALPFFGLSGAGAIAAGIALTLLGGVLKGIGARVGGGGGATGGAGAGAVGGTFSLETDELEESREEGDKTGVVVNVQGNILDRRETGLEIAEIINESFGTNGTVLAQA